MLGIGAMAEGGYRGDGMRTLPAPPHGSLRGTGKSTKGRLADQRATGQNPRRTYRRPKKLNIAITMTTAPTSQMMLFIIVLLLPWEARASGGERGPTSLCRLIFSRHGCRL